MSTDAPVPDRRRSTDAQEIVRLRERVARNDQAIIDLRRLSRALLLCVMVGLLVLGGTSYYVRGQNGVLARHAHAVALQIQASRVESATRACEADNARNKAARLLLGRLFQAPPGPASPGDLKRIQQRQKETERLIDAIVPSHFVPDPRHPGEKKDNCAAFVGTATHIPLDGEAP